MAVLTNSSIIPATDEKQVKEIKKRLSEQTVVSSETIKAMKSLPKIGVKRENKYVDVIQIRNR